MVREGRRHPLHAVDVGQHPGRGAAAIAARGANERAAREPEVAGREGRERGGVLHPIA